MQRLATFNRTKKQAVVLVHGMGEQRPMESIRSFVSNIWKLDPFLEEPHFWNKPSSVSTSFEQRRITTNTPINKENNKHTQRVDFYEYYWAHHTVGTKWEHFTGWLVALMFRHPSSYREHSTSLLKLYYLLWSLFAMGILVAIAWCTISDFESWLPTFLTTALSAIWIFLLGLAKKFFTNYFGDVARYVQAKPINIKVRQDIRKGGVELIERIHRTGDYDRVILVGHSLGSIVAYDLLTHLWARANKFKTSDEKGSVPTPLSEHAKDLIEQLSQKVEKQEFSKESQTHYWQLQRDLFNELKANSPDNNWLISDFVTLGSPLTYADILMFRNNEDFIKRKLDRETPTSPPVTEKGKWYYSDNQGEFLHHGAVFAHVKWTNIYMPHENFYKGDFISGPVSRNFSYIHIDNNSALMTPPRDICRTPIEEIKLDYREIKNGFTHTSYWTETVISSTSKNINLIALRKALGLY
ncbi:hypothetical protein KUC3_28860 [Alteromonas sp. KC3]|uniref:hypothetical protein n=1 Tax=unclassified Alteromonas TaxID=2614992 RepID=UPI001921CD03|nr:MULTISPECIES: hypothetical protein [unclassified Alteromonas]BCO20029.1 hypothetical protein KUC3_28860 [Alteromonas sp. KC3]BCO23994.1 hypothetical protein KUC14_28630 [Alteromonas sp. KC14]